MQKSHDLKELLNDYLLEELQENIKSYAKTHIKNFIESQDYERLRKEHNKLNLFTDTEFPPTNRSVFFNDSFKEYLRANNRLSPNGDVVWKRAKEMHEAAARLVTDKNGVKCSPMSNAYSHLSACIRCTDLNQGYLGNCWFVAAASGIIGNLDLFRKIVPADNTFDDDDYSGLFHFRFWINGEWYDVCIDDFLPVASDGRLNFCHNNEYPNEFWCALLEKAYAKIHGSYQALEGGFTTEALVDMSGGVEETFELTKIQANVNDSEMLWQILLEARNKNSVICCNIEPEPNRTEVELPNGLVKGHAYIVSTLATLPMYERELRLLKCINPWGTEFEWNGDWSKHSSLWTYLNDRDKKILLDEVKAKGQFWYLF